MLVNLTTFITVLHWSLTYRTHCLFILNINPYILFNSLCLCLCLSLSLSFSFVSLLRCFSSLSWPLLLLSLGWTKFSLSLVGGGDFENEMWRCGGLELVVMGLNWLVARLVSLSLSGCYWWFVWFLVAGGFVGFVGRYGGGSRLGFASHLALSPFLLSLFFVVSVLSLDLCCFSPLAEQKSLSLSL